MSLFDSVEENKMRERLLKYCYDFIISEGCAKMASSFRGGREEAGDA